MTQQERSRFSPVVRQSVSLPLPLARRVKALARPRNTSASMMVTELIESGLEAAENQRRRFFGLTDKLVNSTDPVEQEQVKEALAELTFGS
jgi:hypothetical protein